ncbi:hypothetical protein GGX14DRAFT_399671 [Mycena pura]|uniref:Uncharacterized protein n=1 Tax=Mycena pura TaxID=153505 RepID=A0AAD6V4L4_9AGAR|nr:hypothetical protein GGX14DRAFT_399671 [Mycena pura]
MVIWVRQRVASQIFEWQLILESILKRHCSFNGDSDIEEVVQKPPKKKPGPKPKRKAVSKAKSARAVVLMVPKAHPRATSASIETTMSFEDALELIHETIGCVSVVQKPTLAYNQLPFKNLRRDALTNPNYHRSANTFCRTTNIIGFGSRTTFLMHHNCCSQNSRPIGHDLRPVDENLAREHEILIWFYH